MLTHVLSQRKKCWIDCRHKLFQIFKMNNSTTGEGGIVTANNKKLWEKMCGHLKIMENHSMLFTKTEKTRFKWFTTRGTN